MAAKYLQQQSASPAPATGAMLKTHLKAIRLSVGKLAVKMSRTYSSVSGYIKRRSIQTALLWELCHVLKYNFFADIAAQLPPDFASAPATTAPHAGEVAALQMQIKELEERLRIVTAERDVLERVLGRQG